MNTAIAIPLDQIRHRSKSITGQRVSQEMATAQPRKRVGIATLGCKINTYESGIISQCLKTDGWQQVDLSEVADLYLINTCTVTREADRQARQQIRRVVKSNPEALVVVTGCYAQMNPQACAEIPGVDLVLGNDRKLEIRNLLPQLFAGELPKVMVGDLHEDVGLPQQILHGYQGHTRAFVQIQQGCDQGCTFCIIHVARGSSRSLPVNLVLRQIERLALNGFAEMVICGVDLGSYGEDFAAPEMVNLTCLLKEILALPIEDNPFRIRLSSLDPAHISDELIDLMQAEPRICNHLHLSLQSGNNLILKRMKRRYDADFMRQRVLKLRQHIPDLVISADIMVGFPTETIEQFADTLTMLDELEIAYPHVFSYSARDGTPAARIPPDKQVPVAEKKRRNAVLRARGKQIEQKLLDARVGCNMKVLPENRIQGDYTRCRSEEYIPVLLKTADVQPGRWQAVKIEQRQVGNLLGRPV